MDNAGRADDWRDRANCLEGDPELFFPTGSTGPALLQIEEAKQICASCPVIEECRMWALENNMEYGVWGGLSEDERRALRNGNKKARRVGRAAITS